MTPRTTSTDAVRQHTAGRYYVIRAGLGMGIRTHVGTHLAGTSFLHLAVHRAVDAAVHVVVDDAMRRAAGLAR